MKFLQGRFYYLSVMVEKTRRRKVKGATPANLDSFISGLCSAFAMPACRATSRTGRGPPLCPYLTMQPSSCWTDVQQTTLREAPIPLNPQFQTGKLRDFPGLTGPLAS